MLFSSFLKSSKIKAIKIYLELKSTRELVGSFKSEDNKYLFSYERKYLDFKYAIPLGPEFPLTKLDYESSELFPFFVDRIPSKDNPAYSEYCEKFGIDPCENNILVLLATIGSRGPSSFIFEPFWESFTAKNLKEFRKELGLSTRDFAECFGVTQSSIVNIENGKSSGSETLRIIEIYQSFPFVAYYYIEKYANKLHSKKKKLLEMRLLTDRLDS